MLSLLVERLLDLGELFLDSLTPERLHRFRFALKLSHLRRRCRRREVRGATTRVVEYLRLLGLGGTNEKYGRDGKGPQAAGNTITVGVGAGSTPRRL